MMGPPTVSATETRESSPREDGDGGGGGGRVGGVSRLDRLFTLLSTSSTSATRTLAARQIAEVVRAHPEELDVILQHLHPILHNGQWDTRMAAVEAITEIMKVSEFSGREVNVKKEEKEEDDPGGGEVKSGFRLETFNLRSVLGASHEMKASKGEEYVDDDATGVSNEDQRREINHTLGLDVAAKLGVASGDDIISNEDLAAPTQGGRDQQESPNGSTPTASGSASVSSAMSKRERNKLKRALSKQQRQSVAATKKRKTSPRLYKAKRERFESPNWPLTDFCRKLKEDLFHEKWEVRHGSATALREIIRLQGSRAGINAGMSEEEASRARSLWLQDLGLSLVVVIAKDRFGDFVSDQMVAPVRESSAQALGFVVDLLVDDGVLRFSSILLELLGETDWQSRHGAMLAFKYLLASRSDLANLLLSSLYPAIYQCLHDDVDDVVGAAAAALVPVVSNLVCATSTDVTPLSNRLWDALKTLDDLTSSTHSVMHLLSELMRHQSDKYPDSLKLSNVNLADLVSRLFPFLSHSSTTVRKAALNTLNTMTSRLDLAELFLPAVVQPFSSHLFQRALLEHNEANLGLVEQIWNNLCDYTPLRPLLMSTCPLYGTWVALVTQPPNWALPQNFLIGKAAEGEAQYLGGPEAAHRVDPVEKEKLVTRARWLGAKLLGKLAGFIVQPVPGMDYSKDEMPPMEMFASKILLPHLQTASAYRRAAMALIITEWCNQHETKDVPDSLKLLLNTFLIETVTYDETVSALNVLRTETWDFVSTMKHYKLQIPAALGKNSPQDLTLEDLKKGIADQNYDQLFGNTRVKKSVLKGLIERKEGLAQSLASITKEHGTLTVMALAATAGAVISIGALTDKLNPVLKPLMESIKVETNEQMQTHSALMLANILEICISRDVTAPVDKVIKNLVNFVSWDPSTTLQFCQDPAAPENSVILTLKLKEAQSAKKPKKSAKSESAAEASSAVSANQVLGSEKSRGARIALETIVRHFHASVFSRLPKLHELTLGAIMSWEMENCRAVAEFGYCLRALEVIVSVLSSSVYPSLVSALPNLVLLCCNEHANVRHLSSLCLGEISRVQPIPVVSCVVERVIPLLCSDRCKDRQGAIECLSSVVEKMEMDVIPYIALLIVPVLGRMSDHNESVRLMATSTFATLIKLIPLDGSMPEPTGLPAELAKKKLEEQKFMDQLLNANHLDDYELPVAIGADLRSYQRVGVKWLAFLNRYQLHGILCDDMGLGKTLQTICMLASDHFHKREEEKNVSTLIVCPPTLCRHWQTEIVKFDGSATLRPLIYSGPASSRATLRKDFARHNVIISSYDVVRNDLEVLGAIHWNYVVLDEGHVIKNGRTKTTQAIKQLRSSHRLILSGTPIQNSVLELWSLFDYLMPGFLGTEKQFMSKYSRPIVASRDSKCSAREQEAGALAMEALHRQVLPFILRRMKEDVLKDLPPKITQDYYCDLSPIQVKLYEDFTRSQSHILDNDPAKVASDGAEQVSTKSHRSHVFQALQYLRKVCNHPKLALGVDHKEYASVQAMLRASNSTLDDIGHSAKLPALRDLLLQCGIGSVDPGGNSVVVQHRALIFFQLKAMMDIVENDLFRKEMPSVSYLRLDGAVPVGERQGVVDKFNGDASIDVLLITSSVGGMGLNLTGADTVIFVEHDWNPMKDLQAMDRAHRIGQKKVVNVYRLITRNTIEEKIMGLQKFKLMTANTVISSDNASLHSMATDSVVDLFSLENSEPQTPGPDDADEKASKKVRQEMRGTTSVKELLSSMPELWDEKQYEEEYDIKTFMEKTKKP